MRNIGGFLAQRKLTRSIISMLRVAGKSFEMLHAETNTLDANAGKRRGN